METRGREIVRSMPLEQREQTPDEHDRSRNGRLTPRQRAVAIDQWLYGSLLGPQLRADLIERLTNEFAFLESAASTGEVTITLPAVSQPGAKWDIRPIEPAAEHTSWSEAPSPNVLDQVLAANARMLKDRGNEVKQRDVSISILPNDGQWDDVAVVDVPWENPNAPISNLDKVAAVHAADTGYCTLCHLPFMAHAAGQKWAVGPTGAICKACHESPFAKQAEPGYNARDVLVARHRLGTVFLE